MKSQTVLKSQSLKNIKTHREKYLKISQVKNNFKKNHKLLFKIKIQYKKMVALKGIKSRKLQVVKMQNNKI